MSEKGPEVHVYFDPSKDKSEILQEFAQRPPKLQENGSGLKNCMEQKCYGGWFTKLSPLIQSDPELGIEPVA